MAKLESYIVTYERKDTMSENQFENGHFDTYARDIDEASFKAQRGLFEIGMSPPAQYDIWNATITKKNTNTTREILKEGGWLIDDNGKPLSLEEKANQD